MPELPEVETVAQTVGPVVLGHTLVWAENSRSSLRLPLPDWSSYLGKMCTGLTRHGKYLFFEFSNQTSCVAHLGMSGRFDIQAADAPILSHTHVRWRFENNQELRYRDPRRFGFLEAHPVPVSQIALRNRLGPDPLQPGFSTEYLLQQAAATARPLKAFLLDQKVLAGMGNIYVSEALFVARLSPFTPANDVSPQGISRLVASVRAVLQEAVENRGTSLSATGYRDANGEGGRHQHALRVYNRAGDPCYTCQQPIVREVQSQRSTYFCPCCQG